MHACACICMVKNNRKHSKIMKKVFLHEPYMSLSHAWWKKYFFHDFQMFSIIFDHAQACVRWSKYTTVQSCFNRAINEWDAYCTICQCCQPNHPNYNCVIPTTTTTAVSTSTPATNSSMTTSTTKPSTTTSKPLTSTLSTISTTSQMENYTIRPDPMYGCILNYINDGYCDDENNRDCCNFDSGDCCKKKLLDWDRFCTNCKCLNPWGF